MPVAAPNDLPPVRRIVTGHNPQGQAIFVADSTFETNPLGPTGSVGFKVIYETETTPANNNDEPFQDPMFKGVNDIGNKQGTILRIVDVPPKQEKAFMHRTETVDYGVVLEGEVVCVLDSGEEKIAKKGDIVIQRGTSHGWINRTDDWARVLFAIIAAHPAKVEDKVLGREGYDPQRVATGPHKHKSIL